MITPRPGSFTPGSDAVHVVQEAGWAVGQVWTRPHRVLIFGPSIPSQVPVATELFLPPCAGSAVKRSYGRVIIFHLCVVRTKCHRIKSVFFEGAELQCGSPTHLHEMAQK